MPDSKSCCCKNCHSKDAPVMCCHPANGGVTARLVRGKAPSTPHPRRSEIRRMSVKKFFRVTPEEHRLIAFNAAASGLEQSSYLRMQALGKSKVRRMHRIRADWDELRRCLGVINRAGNVVNQLVVALHGVGANSKHANAALAEMIEAGRAIVKVMKEK